MHTARRESRDLASRHHLPYDPETNQLEDCPPNAACPRWTFSSEYEVYTHAVTRVTTAPQLQVHVPRQAGQIAQLKCSCNKRLAALHTVRSMQSQDRRHNLSEILDEALLTRYYSMASL
jgi:hypothetical protein